MDVQFTLGVLIGVMAPTTLCGSLAVAMYVARGQGRRH